MPCLDTSHHAAQSRSVGTGARDLLRVLVVAAVTAVAACGGQVDPSVRADDVAPDAAADSGPDASSDAALTRTTTWRHLGALAIDPQTGASEALRFEVGAGVRSFGLTVSSSSDVLLAIADVVPPGELAAPSWVTWPDDPENTGRVCWRCAWPSHLDRGSATLLSERGDGARPPAGTWSLRVVGRAPSRVDGAFGMPATPIAVDAWIAEVVDPRADDHEPVTPLVVDVAVWTRRDLETDAIADWLLDVDASLADAHIGVGTIEVAVLGGAAELEVDDAGAIVGLPGAVGDARGPTGGPAPVRIVVADAITDEAGQPVLAFSGGLPGPVHAVTGAGDVVIINLPYALSVGVEPGALIAHELGHQLGLQHTIERGAGPGTVGHDRLDDTESSDSSNLMFWEARVGGHALSDAQIRVMRAHPRLRAAAD